MEVIDAVLKQFFSMLMIPSDIMRVPFIDEQPENPLALFPVARIDVVVMEQPENAFALHDSI